MHPLFHRALLSFCLVAAIVAPRDVIADITVSEVTSHPDKRPGLFKRIFGRKAERIKDEDDDGSHRLHLFGPRQPRTTTIVTTTTSITPPSVQPPPFEQPIPHVPERTQVVSPSGTQYWLEPHPLTPPPPSNPQPYAISQEPRAHVPDSVVVVSPAVPSMRVAVTPPAPLPSPGVSSYIPARTDNASVVVIPPTRKGPDAQGTTREFQPPSQPSPSISRGSSPGALPPAGVPPSATATGSPQPSQPPQVPFGKPVPGRQGLVYPPGLSESRENFIDVTGIPSGTKVRDPVTKTVFRVP